MAFPIQIAAGLTALVVVAAVGVLTSRTAIERLVAMGVLPRVFANAVPLLTLAGRGLAVAMIVFGGAQLGVATGVLSQQWLERYGFSVLLLVLGVILLAFSFHKSASA